MTVCCKRYIKNDWIISFCKRKRSAVYNWSYCKGRKAFLSRPGCTGYWSVRFRDNQEQLPKILTERTVGRYWVQYLTEKDQMLANQTDLLQMAMESIFMDMSAGKSWTESKLNEQVTWTEWHLGSRYLHNRLPNLADVIYRQLYFAGISFLRNKGLKYKPKYLYVLPHYIYNTSHLPPRVCNLRETRASHGIGQQSRKRKVQEQWRTKKKRK